MYRNFDPNSLHVGLRSDPDPRAAAERDAQRRALLVAKNGPIGLASSRKTGTTIPQAAPAVGGGTGTVQPLSFNDTGTGVAPGGSFNGATAVALSYHSLGAQKADPTLTAFSSLAWASGSVVPVLTGADTFVLRSIGAASANDIIDRAAGDTRYQAAGSYQAQNANLTSIAGLSFTGNALKLVRLNAAATGFEFVSAPDPADGDKGDITISGGVWSIDAAAVTLAKMANIATATFIGRSTAGTGVPEALTVTQATALLNTFTSALKGLAPASGGGTVNFLRADGTWAAPPGAGGAITASGYTMATARMLGRTTAATGAIEEMTAAQVKSFLAIAAADVSGLSALATSTDAANLSGTVAAARMPAFTGGDVTSSAGSVNLSIGAGTVTLAKMANVATATVFYRKTAGSGAPEVQTLATLKTDLGLTGTNSGDQFTNMTTSRILGRVTAGFGAAEELTQAQVRTFLGLGSAAYVALGGASGAASLDANSKVPAAQLPAPTSINPMDHGAVGDGTTNDATALAAAFTAAWAANLPIDGGFRVYAVSGDLAITSITNPQIRRLRLKQTNPSDTRKTLNFSSCERIQIDRLEIDLGASPTLGAMNTSGGLWVDGGSNHRIAHVEVIGQGEGNGVVFWNCSHSVFEHIRVRDIVYSNSTATNDVLNGVWLSNCTNCILRNPVVSNLTGNANVSFPTRYTRGIVMSGCVRCSIVDPHVSDVDQGIDYTGSAGNRGCSTIGGHAYNCCTVGHKHANSSNNCKVVGFTAERCGTHGFLAQGPAEAGLTYKCQDNEYIGCTAIDAGYNAFSGGSKFGFSVEPGGFDTSFPKGIRFVGCRAIDSQAVKTMITGFRNSITYDGTAKKPNECVDCLSEGHTSFAQEGIHRVCCRVTLNAAQNITTATPTALSWNGTETEDSMGMHDTGTNPERITISIPGLYRVRAKATYASNATGFRRLQVLKNASTNIAVNAFAPVPGELTTCMWDQLVDLVAGDYVWTQVEQNSGSTLAVGNTNSFFEVELVRRA